MFNFEKNYRYLSEKVAFIELSKKLPKIEDVPFEFDSHVVQTKKQLLNAIEDLDKSFFENCTPILELDEPEERMFLTIESRQKFLPDNKLHNIYQTTILNHINTDLESHIATLVVGKIIKYFYVDVETEPHIILSFSKQQEIPIFQILLKYEQFIASLEITKEEFDHLTKPRKPSDWVYLSCTSRSCDVRDLENLQDELFLFHVDDIAMEIRFGAIPYLLLKFEERFRMRVSFETHKNVSSKVISTFEYNIISELSPTVTTGDSLLYFWVTSTHFSYDVRVDDVRMFLESFQKINTTETLKLTEIELLISFEKHLFSEIKPHLDKNDLFYFEISQQFFNQRKTSTNFVPSSSIN